MDLIPSFAVDHTKIIPGIFESRVDQIGEELVTTFDIRLKRPNSEPSIEPAAMHTIIAMSPLMNSSTILTSFLY